MMKKMIAGLIATGATLGTTAAHADEFLAPSGHLGAGLSTTDEQTARAFGDASFYFRSGESFGVSTSQFATALVAGGGYKVIPELEVEARLPVLSYGRFSSDVGDAGNVAVGNLYLGANYILSGDQWRARAGAGVAAGPWNADPGIDKALSLTLSAATRLEQFHLFAPDAVVAYAPGRFEYMVLPEVVASADAAIGFYIPTNGADPDLSLQLAPGAGWVGGDLTAGARLPIFWVPTDDLAQIAFEPYARYDIGAGFVHSAFTLFLDNPFGFSFDRGGAWALFVGGGASF